MIGIKDQYFGTEIEMTGITRQRAAEVVAEMFGTEAYYDGTTYGVWSVIDLEGNAKSYYTEIRKISDELCRKYGLSIIESDQKKSIPYVQWKAEQEGKPTWRSAIRLDIRESVQESYSWSQFLKEMEKRGYTRMTGTIVTNRAMNNIAGVK